MPQVEKPRAKAKVKLHHARAIVQFKEWVGTRGWNEIPWNQKIEMFDHFVDKNAT
jgi:hypothetical protein